MTKKEEILFFFLSSKIQTFIEIFHQNCVKFKSVCTYELSKSFREKNLLFFDNYFFFFNDFFFAKQFFFHNFALFS